MVKALIVIDMMQGYMKDVYRKDVVKKNLLRLMDTFRKNNLPVILAIPDPEVKNPVMIRLWGDETEDNPDVLKPIPEIKDYKFDKVIRKGNYSSFYKTELGKYCKKKEIDEIFFTGVFSSCCVFFSAIDAAYREIQPYLVIDAVGGSKRDLAKGWKENTMKRFELMIGPLKTTEETIKNISN